MDSKSLTTLCNLTFHVIRVNTEGLTHQEGLVQPAGGGNCLDWVLGHVISTRNAILKLLGAEPIINEDNAKRYHRGSAPIAQASEALSLQDMLADMVRSQEILTGALARVSEAKLSKPLGESTVGEQLAVLNFHEAYHAGQIGPLRRVAGKSGMIA